MVLQPQVCVHLLLRRLICSSEYSCAHLVLTSKEECVSYWLRSPHLQLVRMQLASQSSLTITCRCSSMEQVVTTVGVNQFRHYERVVEAIVQDESYG
jgi:hypothetical protein